MGKASKLINMAFTTSQQLPTPEQPIGVQVKTDLWMSLDIRRIYPDQEDIIPLIIAVVLAIYSVLIRIWDRLRLNWIRIENQLD